VLTGISLGLLPFIKGSGLLSWHILALPAGRAWWELLGALGLLAVGSSLTRPPLFGLLSNLTAANEQGANIGVAQSAGSLARIVGQFGAPIILLHGSHYALYLGSALILFVTSFVVAKKLLSQAREPQAQPV